MRYELFLQQGEGVEVPRATAQYLLKEANVRTRARCISTRGKVAGFVLVHGKLISNLLIKRA